MGKPEPLPGGIDEVRHHGGNINVARRLFPNAPEPWIDLSTGINPVPYPIGAIAPSAWTSLPQAADIQALEETARTAYGAGTASEIVAAPGTQALIQWLPRLITARTVGILGVTYGEHERTWRASGAEVARVERLDDLAAFDIGVVVNPNNPDGRTVPPAALLETASVLAAQGGLLVVDEAFADVLDAEASLIPELPRSGAVVLRSFGKIYGWPGFVSDSPCPRTLWAGHCAARSVPGRFPVRPSRSADARLPTEPGSRTR